MSVLSAFRDLAKILHPDHGGSTHSMQALNALQKRASLAAPILTGRHLDTQRY